MTLQELAAAQGAVLAPDGIPLHFGNLAGEYHAALNGAVLLNRSHEGRLDLTGRDRLAFLHRISTNDLNRLTDGEGCPTIFTSPTARILERATLYHRGEHALAISEPGRGDALGQYLQRNIFFNDEARVVDVSAQTHQFALHGTQADAVIDMLVPGASALPAFHSMDARTADADVFVARNKALVGTHWTIIMSAEESTGVWSAMLESGAAHGLRPAGSLTYNVLRIRAGRPGVGRELSQDYIPLEVGLWDEVSFNKGCYTGQEIIARMESRNRLAKIMVMLRLNAPVDAPAEVYIEGRGVGMLTSSVTTPDGEHVGIGVIRTGAAQPGESVTVGVAGVEATIIGFAGAPPPSLAG